MSCSELLCHLETFLRCLFFIKLPFQECVFMSLNDCYSIRKKFLLILWFQPSLLEPFLCKKKPKKQQKRKTLPLLDLFHT